jgi:hypothetical protein
MDTVGILFRAYRADFFIDHRPACCEKEEYGEREKDSWKYNRGGMSRAQDSRGAQVDAPTPVFCQRLYFVDAYILSTSNFC